MVKTKLKKDDSIVIIAGKDRGKRGKALFVDRRNGRIVVEGINKKKEFVKTQENPKGVVVTKEFPIHISDVMLFCDKCKKGVKLGIKELEKKKVRVCRKCGKNYD